jgi:Ni/Co efflux regulator RcnB
MNKILALSLTILMAGVTATVDAVPRDGDGRGDRGRHGHYQHDQGRHYKHGGYGHGDRHGYTRHRGHHDRYDYRHHGGYVYRPRHHHHRYPAPAYYVRPHGYRTYRWASGHYLPRHYYGPTYYVDYGPYGLAVPPYGHRWVRYDNDVFLVALATGLIVDSVYGLFY